MAKLSAHGEILYRLSFPNYDEVLASDGTILRNHGWGWKLEGKVKKGESPQEVAEKMIQWYRSRPPEFHEYIRALKDAVALSHRWRLHELIKLMPDDPDGIWGDLADHGLHVDFSDIANAARAYKAYLRAKYSAPKSSAE